MLINEIAAVLTSSDKLGLALLLLLAFGLFLSIYTIFVLHRRVNIREESYEEVPSEEKAEETAEEEVQEEEEAAAVAEEVEEESQPEEEPEEEPQPEPEPEPQPEEVHSTLEENQMSDLVRESVSVEEADEAISDELAEELTHVQYESAKLKGAKKEKYIVNVDIISDKFESGDEVNLETLKEKGLLPKKCNYFKVLARGVLDKKIKVVANEYSGAAIKMILLTGGEVVVLE